MRRFRHVNFVSKHKPDPKNAQSNFKRQHNGLQNEHFSDAVSEWRAELLFVIEKGGVYVGAVQRVVNKRAAQFKFSHYPHRKLLALARNAADFCVCHRNFVFKFPDVAQTPSEHALVALLDLGSCNALLEGSPFSEHVLQSLAVLTRRVAAFKPV